MKKLFIFALLSAFSSISQAYDIGGMYATLEKCEWGSYGYQYGNIGTYKGSDGKYYQVFFGSNYCQH